MIHTRLHMRTGDEIREVVGNAAALYIDDDFSFYQYRWATTFLTLPPSASALESRVAA
jgi:hypothetical protein